MKKNGKPNLIEELSIYIRKISGYNLSLSYKEVKIVENAIERGISLTTLKRLIKKEIKKYPPEKKKKFTLLFLEKEIENITQKRSKKGGSSILKWKEVLEKHNLPADILDNIPSDITNIAAENLIINLIWRNIPIGEKREIIKEAYEKMKKGFILSNINQEKVIRSIIRGIIRKKYLSSVK